MDEKKKDPIASAMARKRWDKLTDEERSKETAPARLKRWEGHVSKKPRKVKS